MLFDRQKQQACRLGVVMCRVGCVLGGRTLSGFLSVPLGFPGAGDIRGGVGLRLERQDLF